MDEWIKKMWHVYAMGYYFAIKNQDFLSYVTKWMRLEGIMLSEIRQTEKYSMISLMWATRKLSRFIFIFKKCFGYICGTCKFPGQGLNPETAMTQAAAVRRPDP